MENKELAIIRALQYLNEVFPEEYKSIDRDIRKTINSIVPADTFPKLRQYFEEWNSYIMKEAESIGEEENAKKMCIDTTDFCSVLCSLWKIREEYYNRAYGIFAGAAIEQGNRLFEVFSEILSYFLKNNDTPPYPAYEVWKNPNLLRGHTQEKLDKFINIF